MMLDQEVFSTRFVGEETLFFKMMNFCTENSMSLPPFKEAKKTNLNYTNPIVENYH